MEAGISFTEALFTFGLAVSAGAIIWLTLLAVGQRWVSTFSYTVTYLVLPVVGFVIVEVIANNIALSLGLVGALSIVRFRHPVKSPLELVIYFLLLTVGIALGIRPMLAMSMVFAVAAIIVVVTLIQKFRARAGKEDYALTSIETDRKFLLEITSQSDISSAAESKALVFFSKNPELKEFSYKLAFAERREFDQQQEHFRSLNAVKTITGYVA